MHCVFGLRKAESWHKLEHKGLWVLVIEWKKNFRPSVAMTYEHLDVEPQLQMSVSSMFVNTIGEAYNAKQLLQRSDHGL
jgi:hypothetical protein